LIVQCDVVQFVSLPSGKKKNGRTRPTYRIEVCWISLEPTRIASSGRIAGSIRTLANSVLQFKTTRRGNPPFLLIKSKKFDCTMIRHQGEH